MIIKIIFIFIATLSLQTIILSHNEHPLINHIYFTLLLFFIFSIVASRLYLLRGKVLLDPMTWFLFFFSLSYYYSSIYFIFLSNTSFYGNLNENLYFDYSDPEKYTTPLPYIIASLLVFSLPMLLFSPLEKIKKSLTITVNTSRTHFIFISLAIISLLTTQIFYTVLGGYGSLSSFNENFEKSIFFENIKLLFILMPVLIFYLGLIAIKEKRYRIFFITLLIITIIVSFIAGNRRDLITYALPIIIFYLHFSHARIKTTTILYAIFFIYIYLVIGKTYSDSLSIAANQESFSSYLSIIFTTDFFSSFQENLFSPISSVLGWLGQFYLVDTAIYIDKNYQINNAIIPIIDFTNRSIPFINRIIPETTQGASTEYILFKESLIYSIETPYLTNPIIAEGLAIGGVLGLTINSLFAGVLMLFFNFLFFYSNSNIYKIWYISYFPVMSYGFIQSTSGALTVSIKALFALMILSIFYKLLRKRIL